MNWKQKLGCSWLALVAIGFTVVFAVFAVQQFGWATLLGGVGLGLFLESIVIAVILIWEIPSDERGTP